MPKVNPVLLFDLARVFGRYTPDEWRDLMLALQNPAFHDQLLYFVEQARRISDESRRRPAPSSRAAELEFRRAILINQIRSDLRSRPLAELRELAAYLDLDADPRSKRDGLIKSIVRTLSTKTLAEIRKTASASLIDDTIGEDYDRWGRLIMGTPGKGKSSR